MSNSPDANPAAVMPISTFLRLAFRERTEERAVVGMPLRAEFMQTEQRLHGGLIATLADSAAVYLLYGDFDPARTLTSIEFKLNFVRPALLERGEVEARAQLVRRGRTVGLVDVEVFQAGALVAKGLFTYLFGERASSPKA